MDDDWDLHAVVRGCSTANAATTTSATATFTADLNQSSCFSAFSVEQQSGHRNIIFGELRDLYTPFLHESDLSVSSLPCLNHQQQRQEHKRPLSFSASPSSATSKVPNSNTSRSKRRKIQQKRVSHVPAEALNSDVWAWRKYGQKPIKGSPYPRGYYRCSTSKGCLARKQVERSRSDQKMFIVTYTAEHNHPAPTHRNSLAGSTRQKPSNQPQSAAGAGDPAKSPTSTSVAGVACSSSSPATSTEELVMVESTTVEDLVVDNLEGDGDLLSLSDTVVSDDFFEGLEGFAGGRFSGDSPACFGLCWLANSDAEATAGGI